MQCFHSALLHTLQESRAVAKKPLDAAAVLFGLKFADDIHYKFKSSQASKGRLQSSNAVSPSCEIGGENVHIAISRCRSLLQSPGVSFFVLDVVENPRFAVEIAVICHTVGDINTSGFHGHIAISGYLSMSNLSLDTFF